MNHDLLLFDLDGTISDPLPGIARSLNHALTHFGYAAVGTEEVRAYIGPPLDRTFRMITGQTCPAHIRELVAKYRERYAEVGFAENTLYPGVKEALFDLRTKGAAMAICTSKRADFAERILARFGLAACFRFIDGGDSGIEKWQQIAAMRADGRVAGSALMIGDRAVDLDAARRNGISGGAVLWGFGSAEELREGAPDYWFESPREWLQLYGDN